MTEQECLDRMVAPGTPRPGKYRDGVIQVHITRACDKSCFACTQGSNLAGPTTFMSPDQFEAAVRSLGFRDGDGARPPFTHGGDRYYGVVGVFGGNPALSPHLAAYCETLKRLVPFGQRGVWCNNPVTVDKARLMRETFDPAVSNLNVHLDEHAWSMFRAGWPEARPVGLTADSRHSPVHLAMRDVVADEGERYRLISDCDINQHWSAMVGVFRGGLRAWFCEVAGAQAMLHQLEPDYPDTGIDLGHAMTGMWWQWGMEAFQDQVRKHCHECGVPLRGYGQLSQAEAGFEQTSATHERVFRPKRKDRRVEVVTNLVQLDVGKIQSTIRYIQNGRL